jgi:2-methylcitrate dehydratase
VQITTTDGRTLDSGLVMYPSGHARNTTADLEDILAAKSRLLGDLAMDDASIVITRCDGIASLDAAALATIWDFTIRTGEAID